MPISWPISFVQRQHHRDWRCRLLVDPFLPRRRSDRLGAVRDGVDHAWRERPRSGVGRTRNVVAPTSLAGQFEQTYGPVGPPTLFTMLLLRYMILPSPPRKRGPRGKRRGPGALGSRFRGNDEIKGTSLDGDRRLEGMC
jgi:hypothetical protein